MKLNAFHLVVVVLIVSIFSVSSEDQTNGDIEYIDSNKISSYNDELCKDI
ncbi:hypothetical protein DDB_G0275685 [Dictyostelium discoideum AX4]|uniref:Putative uncharacterized protein DDB_G0275685 n=1 Tax=Dictyostelium discoideum TaxID=44689 RepID=Y7269_DICDI|nr:hypothetical protein DDB_G0275685 [Dictyostelium discoideum AX4]Q86HC2.1 RecName: Full=Putative uncharacterized protein DDB_G0275685; Flags: Precursor [Dictyostelium discoideum]EAL69593.1 hypothetical protein DDB_G0275685 [Dictyostelium discoideum AX4]|eukprot:XP_643489.1 hypothetical protein DDB_G0275685 [Dictyostelium discoideum AX4]